jgi:hypothetical protein
MPKPADLSVTGLRRRYVLTPHRHLSSRICARPSASPQRAARGQRRLRSRLGSERGVDGSSPSEGSGRHAIRDSKHSVRLAWRLQYSRAHAAVARGSLRSCGVRRAHAEAGRGCAASGHAVSLFWPQRWRRRCARNCSRRRRRDAARDVASESRDGVAAVRRAALGYVEAAALSKRVCLARRRPRPPESRFDGAPRRGVGGRRCG